MNDYELLRVIEFMEKVRTPFLQRIPGAGDDPYWNIVVTLVRNHITGRMATVSSLAQMSGAPYATAVRKINSMIDEGLITRRPKFARSKTFSLHPSGELLAAFIEQATDVKILVAQTIGLRPGAESESEYYFGGSAIGTQTIPPLKLVEHRLKLAQDVRFLLHNDNYFVAMQNMWSDMRNNLASRSDFELQPLPLLHARALENARAPEPIFDVVSINMPWLGEFAEAGHIRPLDDFVGRGNIQALDFHPSVWATGTWADKQYGLPIYCTAESLLARRDLFEAGDFAYPRKFADVLSVGRELHQPDKQVYGISWNGARGMPIASTFMFLMGCCGSPIISTKGRPRHLSPHPTSDAAQSVNIDTESGEIVLDYLHRLIEISPPSVLEADWNMALKTFMTGHAAMAYCWTMRAARCEYDLQSVVKRKVEYLPQPAGPNGQNVTPLGGFLLTLPSSLSDERAELAFEAIEWMASREAMKEHVKNGFPVAPRFSVSSDPEAAATSPIVRFVDRLARRNMLHSWQRPPIPAYRAIEDTIGTEIHRALSGEIDDKTALRCVQDTVEKLLAA
jgi:multiple sugar transport system substrate-binding protein